LEWAANSPLNAAAFLITAVLSSSVAKAPKCRLTLPLPTTCEQHTLLQRSRQLAELHRLSFLLATNAAWWLIRHWARPEDSMAGDSRRWTGIGLSSTISRMRAAKAASCKPKSWRGLEAEQATYPGCLLRRSILCVTLTGPPGSARHARHGSGHGCRSWSS
jgi:hypothetical protein